eukprot:1151022-Pelagomonas_calceolata.AAC.2
MAESDAHSFPNFWKVTCSPVRISWLPPTSTCRHSPTYRCAYPADACACTQERAKHCVLSCAQAVLVRLKTCPTDACSLFGEEGTSYRVDWEPEEAAALAVVCASFRCVPDLLWAKQVHMQVRIGEGEGAGGSCSAGCCLRLL